MSEMQWNRKMSVGLEELDHDHQDLIGIINQLGADYRHEDRRAAVRQSLLALQRYAEYHFAREERVMMACGYPELEEHQGEHRGFIEKIKDLTRRFDEDPDSSAEFVNEKLMNFLQDWLKHHIMIEDKAYGPSIENNPAAKEAAKSFQAAQIWWSS